MAKSKLSSPDVRFPLSVEQANDGGDQSYIIVDAKGRQLTGWAHVRMFQNEAKAIVDAANKGMALESVPEPDPMPELKQDRYESSRDFGHRLLCSMFQEVYAHTGRQMPGQMYDRVSEFMDMVVETVREDRKNWV